VGRNLSSDVTQVKESSPQLEASSPSNLDVGDEHSRKGPFKQLVNSYSEHLHMSAQPVENARDITPPSACVT
jgi:hypothetical protein